MRAALGDVRTTCPYCGVGCGVVVAPDGAGGAAVSGDVEHPSNFGRLCSKGAALGETLSLEGRLLHPMLRTRSGAYERSSWEDALDRVAEGFARAKREHGPEAVAFYLSGQLLTEDYYVANKLMKGFIGSANVDTNSRLCMSSSVAGHKRVFGEDVVPGAYRDFDEADLIVLVGSNAAWCHPVLHQRMAANRASRGAKLVVLDPRRTPSADEADLFLGVAPGMDAVLFAFLLTEIARRGAVDRAYVDAHTLGFDDALANAHAIAPDLASASARTGLTAADLQAFCDLWIATPKVVTAWSQGVNQSAQGTDKVDAIIHCHLATARVGKPGCGPFSLTGQPNAMGGREVGGLANMLAAHMNFSEPDRDRVRRFWNAPHLAEREGLKAVDLFDAMLNGEVRAAWVMATNPVASMPRANVARAALGRLDCFVLSEVVASNDTLNAGAHVLLPASAWGEKDGAVTNSERRISRQRAFLGPAGEAKPDWWIVCEVAKRLGFGDAFAFKNAAAIFREHAALTAMENDGARLLDLGELSALSDDAYETMAPVQWPMGVGGDARDKRLYADGRFSTPDGKARFVSIETPALAAASDAAHPLRLNTGRVRDQWHTMTRTGKSPRLGGHSPEPYVAIHPDDAAHYGLAERGFARLASQDGAATMRVRFDAGLRRGELFSPIHWTGETASDARIGALVASANDPFSGQPELKATPVSAAPVVFAYEGFMLSRAAAPAPPDAWFARVTLAGARGLTLATNSDVALVAWFTATFPNEDRIDYADPARGVTRTAVFAGGALVAALFLAPAGTMMDWSVPHHVFEEPQVAPHRRRLALATREAEGASAGAIVCACFGVGALTIVEAIRGGAHTPAAIGAVLRAGTNCGSCAPELRTMIAAALTPA